jgi:hypothetical protein
VRRVSTKFFFSNQSLFEPRQLQVSVLSPKWSEVDGIEFNPGMPPVIGRTVREADHQLRRISLLSKQAE